MGGRTTTTETQQVQKTPEQHKIAQELTASNLHEATKRGDVFTGDRVASLDPLQSGAIGAAGNFLPGFSQPISITDPLAAETQAATRGVLTGATGGQQLSPDQVSNFFNTSVVDPARQRFTEEVLPGIDESFAGPGFFGSARSNARADAMTGLSDSLRSEESQLQFQNLQRNQDLAEAAAGRTAGVIPAALNVSRQGAVTAQDQIQTNMQQMEGLRNIFGFGEAAQTQEQAELFADFQAFAEKEGLRQESLDIVMNILNEGIVSRTKVDQENPRQDRGSFEQMGTNAAGKALSVIAGGF